MWKIRYLAIERKKGKRQGIKNSINRRVEIEKQECGIWILKRQFIVRTKLTSNYGVKEKWSCKR